MTGPAPFGPDEIERAFLAAGLSALPAETYAQFSSYLTVLLRWNRQLNLTSLRAPEQIVQRHLIECSFAAQHLPRDIATLLDFGSGAGFPGIPIALCRPGIRVTLAEGHGKKAAFLREAVRVMDAPIDVFEGRVETLPTIRRFDAVAVRAVEKMETAVPLAATHVTRYLVLLCTEQSSDGFRASVPELRWLPSIPIPASNQIVIAIGKR